MRGQLRKVLPLTELRTEFSVSRAELLDADRGAEDVDLDDLMSAARRIAIAENVAVFHGWEEAGHRRDHRRVHPRLDPARDRLRRLPEPGRKGRRVPARGRRQRTLWPRPRTCRLHGVVETTEHGGLVVFDHLRQILGGPIVWAPGVEGAVVVSMRGGDFLFESGEDLSVGYSSHDAEHVDLYLEESFTFRVVVPEAAVHSDPDSESWPSRFWSLCSCRFAGRQPLFDHRSEIGRVVGVLLVREETVPRVVQDRQVVRLVHAAVTRIPEPVLDLADPPSAFLVEDAPVVRERRSSRSSATAFMSGWIHS